MTASTAPTQPPDKCPVCLESLVDRASAAFVTFVCGQVMYLDEGGEWKPQTSWECVCERSQQAAVSLRRERDEALAELEGAHALLDRVGVPRGFPEGDDNEGLNYALQYRINIIDEVLKLRDEAKRYSAHLEHENAALAVLHSNAVDERNAALARAEKAEAHIENLEHIAQRRLEDLECAERKCFEYRADLTAARARLAELQAVVDAARKNCKCSVCDGESELFEMEPIQTNSGRWIHRLKEGFSKRDNPTYFRCRLRAAHSAPGGVGEGAE